MLFRAFALVSAGIVAGFLLGGIGPQREISKLSLEIKQLKRQVDRIDRPNPLRELLPALAEGRGGRGLAPRSALPAIARANGQVVNSPDDLADGRGDPGSNAGSNQGAVIIRGSEVAPGSRASTLRPGDGSATADPVPPAEKASEALENRRQRGFGELNLARFDELSAAQAMRFAASRAALIEQAGLNEEETAQVDQTVKKMNDDLAGYGEEILSQASSQEAPSPSQALGLGHDVSGIMYEGQKQLEGIVGKRADGVEPEALEIWNYVDMQRLRPAAEKYLPTESATPEATPAAASATAPASAEAQDEE